MIIKTDTNYLNPNTSLALKEEIPQAFTALESLRNKTCLGKESLGWFNWPAQEGLEMVNKISSYVDDFPLFYDSVVVVGIGGSYAGVKAIQQAMNHDYMFQMQSSLNKIKPIYFLGHNLSEKHSLELLDLLDEKQPLVIVISKSGNTVETALGFQVMENYLKERYDNQERSQRLIMVTSDGQGTLSQISKQENYQMFHIPNDVGGRYSVLTQVGVVPLCFAGYQVTSLMEGGAKLFSEIESSSIDSPHGVMEYAAVRKREWQEGKRIEVLSYNEPKLTSYGEWWKQLFGESEGKKNLGLYPSSMLYSTDLHSLGQYMQEGFPSLMQTFLFFEKPQTPRQKGSLEKRIRVPGFHKAYSELSVFQGHYIHDLNNDCMKAARQSHFDRGISNYTITVPHLDEYYLGYLFAFFQVSCALSGLLLGVNPFDQPGVEAYKSEFRKIYKDSPSL